MYIYIYKKSVFRFFCSFVHKFENTLQICMTGVAVNLNTLFLKEITLTSLFHGASFLQDHPTTARGKDASSTSKKNYLSYPDLNYHHQ